MEAQATSRRSILSYSEDQMLLATRERILLGAGYIVTSVDCRKDFGALLPQIHSFYTVMLCHSISDQDRLELERRIHEQASGTVCFMVPVGILPADLLQAIAPAVAQ